MVELNPSSATTTSLNNASLNYNVSAKTTDTSNEKEYYWRFTEATINQGYYKTIPELKKAVDALALWTTGKGYSAEIDLIGNSLENITGWGEDSFQSICWSLIVAKKIYGDVFCEIIRNESDTVINLKTLPIEQMAIVLNAKGMIKRYEQQTADKLIKYQTYEILHLCNDRMVGECHGTSVIDACMWVIDARNEAMDVYRKILKRSLALGILYIDTDNQTKITEIMTKYKDAVKNEEVLVLPKGVAEIQDAKVSVQDFLAWISYLENFFYQAIGIPKAVLGGSETVSEGGQKVGYLAWEQVYMTEQKLLEEDLWNQLGIKITFERPASMAPDMAMNEAKNTSQTSFQPKDAQVTGGNE